MCCKWNIKFFACIGLTPSEWWFYYKMTGTYSIEEYVVSRTQKNKRDMYKRIQKLKEQGKEYYTKKRLKKMDYSFSR